MRRLSASCAARPNRNGINLDTQQYNAYGSQRGGGTLPTDHAFTGQKRDGTGLLYYNARYYDPGLGQFISPDTIVPDAGLAMDYNRFLYTRGNPIRYTDPSGHCIFGLDTIVCLIAGAAIAGGAANAVGSSGVQVYQNWDSENTLYDNLTNFNGTEAGIAFGYGAVSGALAPVTGGATALVLNGGLGAMQEITSDVVVDGKTLEEAVDTETAIAAGFGVVGGMIQNSIPDELVYSLSEGVELSVATGKDALAYGGSWFMQSSNRALLREQVKVVTRSRFLAGAGIGNVPLPGVDSSDDCGFVTCLDEAIQNWWNGTEETQ